MKKDFEIILKSKNKENNNNNNIYIGILYCGEIQIESLIKSIIQSSSYAKIYSINIYVVGYHKNLEAHQKLYRWFNKHNNQHRLKLDADMTIKKDTIKKLILNKKNHRIIYPVYDFITKTKIYGVHYIPPFHSLDYQKITKRFPDYLNDYFEIKKELIGISHCERATKDQILNFIIHRLGKLFDCKFKMKLGYLKIILKATIVNYKLIYKNLSYIFFSTFKIILQNKNYKNLENNSELDKNKLKEKWKNYLLSNTSFQSE